MYARPLEGIDNPEPPENPYEQATAHFAAGQIGERVRARLVEDAARTRMPRRRFVKTACGLASALAAANAAAGMRVFDVDMAETMSGEAAAERSAAARADAEIIVDAHSHVCWRRDGFVLGKNTTQRGMHFVDMIDGLGKSLGLKGGIRDMTVETFGKLVLDGSDTSVAIVNPFGFQEDYGGKDMMPLEELAQVRERWPGRVILLGGGLTPNHGLSRTLDRLDMFVEKFKVSGLKLYTFDATPKRGWWFDDEKLAYPIWERCRKLGLRNVGCHKGLPFSHFAARHAHPTDMDQAAEDFSDMNWLVFHSAYPYLAELSSLGRAYKPHRKNLYCELGSTFAALVTNQPIVCAHTLGTLLRDFGPDYVLWGTDSLLWADRSGRSRLSAASRSPRSSSRATATRSSRPRSSARSSARMPRACGTFRATPRRPGPPTGDAVPIYEYECRDCGATVEVLQGARDADRSACTDCGGPLARIFSAPRLNTGNFSGPTEAGARRMSSSEETAREKVLQRSYGTLRFPPGVKHDPEGGGE